MSADLFRQVAEGRQPARAGRFAALPISAFVHALVLIAVVVIPLLATEVLPLIQDRGRIEIPVVMAPAPPVAARPAAHRNASSMPARANAAPVEPPTGVGRERLLPSAPQLDAAVPDRDAVSTGEVPGGGTVVGDTLPPAPRPVAPVRVSTLLRPPVKIADVSPIYPEVARAARIDGVVVVEAIIGPTGDVQEARVLSGKPFLDEAALAAVKRWKFAPSLLNGVPVPVIMTVTVRFTLQ